jgi:hypothetical protein
MKTETKFGINNLLMHKYSNKSSKNKFVVLEVMETLIQTCYGGTQIFYITRPIIAEKHGFKDNAEWYVGSASANNGEYLKYREDELIQAPDNVLQIFLGSDSVKVD